MPRYEFVEPISLSSMVQDMLGALVLIEGTNSTPTNG